MRFILNLNAQLTYTQKHPTWDSYTIVSFFIVKKIGKRRGCSEGIIDFTKLSVIQAWISYNLLYLSKFPFICLKCIEFRGNSTVTTTEAGVETYYVAEIFLKGNLWYRSKEHFPRRNDLWFDVQMFIFVLVFNIKQVHLLVQSCRHRNEHFFWTCIEHSCLICCVLGGNCRRILGTGRNFLL